MNLTKRIVHELPSDALALASIDWARALLAGEDVPDRDALNQAAAQGPLSLMSRIFGLSPADEDLLCLLLAHRLDGCIAGLAAERTGDRRHGYISAHLATLTIGGGDAQFGADLVARLHPDAPLRRWGLVTMAETHALAAIELTESVALRLMGQPLDLPPFCRLAPVTGYVPRFQAQADDLVPTLPQGLALVGPARSGRCLLAATLANAAARRAYVLDSDALLAGGGLDTSLRAIARDLLLDGGVAILDADPGAESTRQVEAASEAALLAAGRSEGRRVAEAALRAFAGHLIVLCNDPTGLPDGMHRVRLAPLTHVERKLLWRQSVGPHTLENEVSDVAAQFPLGPSDISEIGASIMEGDPPGTLWRRCRERGGRGLDALATRIHPRHDWDTLVLPDGVIAELRAMANQIRYRLTVLDDWGFGHRLQSGRGVTALLAGPSGVGKTMAAEVVAGDLGLDLYKVDLSRLVSKYIGETEKNLRRVFDAAEETGACLFLDEADACLGKRSEVKDSHDRHANIEVSYLLQRMESYSGLCLMATNLKNNLDAAFLRRLRFVIDLPFPDQGERQKIWQGAFPRETPLEALDWRALAKMDIAGGSIVVIAVNAAFLAASEGGPVTMDRIARAAEGEYRKHDRSFRKGW